MFAKVYSGGLSGVDAYRIEVEVDSGSGMGQILIVGLPDTSVQESQERVRSAVKACAFTIPPGRKWVVNLAPADTKKEGPIYDLPIAIGILASTECIPTTNLGDFWIIGELSLDGSIRTANGVLPISLACKQSNAKAIVVPENNAYEASLVEGLEVYPVSHLRQVCEILSDPSLHKPFTAENQELYRNKQLIERYEDNFADVKGQEHAKRALEIAAAGRHNVLMVGPPGSGKSMLAQRLPGIMPPLESYEALELTKLYSIAGLLGNKPTFVNSRPFRAPHHTSSASGLVGGGSIPKPGEISLSHLGILFLDELTEFPRKQLETLRQPIETGSITISRAQQSLTYPASFLLVGACNPCPCGHRGDPIKYCACTPSQAERYWSKLSGPLLDRIDLHIEVSRLKENELASTGGSEDSKSIQSRVLRAVEMQKLRTADGKVAYNGQLSHSQLAYFCKVDDYSRQLLAKAVTKLGLSARAYDRTLRIARTIADLAGENDISPSHIAEAITYRASFRKGV